MILKKVLIGTPIIDRDVAKFSLYFKAIEELLANTQHLIDILFVNRLSDKETTHFIKEKQKKYANIIHQQIPHYDIDIRHNMEKICEKRQMIMNYAKEHQYDYLFFVDGDIYVTPDTLKKLMALHVDLAFVPYRQFWQFWSKVPIVVYVENQKFVVSTPEQKDMYPTKKMAGGFGCILINKTCFDIPIEIKSIEVINTITNQTYNVITEEVGYFSNAFLKDATSDFVVLNVIHDI
ncbi:MAG: glycosyltransferase family 2 protein [Candidatus Protochlamydia sp.]|nr:glycosyltransferase family 2 protein [Candidatus Protochlamydia sp.]